MSGQDVAVALSAAWLFGVYSAGVVVAFALKRRAPRPVRVVEPLRLMPPEEMLATFNRRLEAAIDGAMLREVGQ